MTLLSSNLRHDFFRRRLGIVLLILLACTGSPEAALSPAPLMSLSGEYSKVHTYRLPPEALHAFAPDPKHANAGVSAPLSTEQSSGAESEVLAPLPETLSATQAEQLKILLKPLVNVEFPNQVLFKAALDAQLCSYVIEIAKSTAKNNNKIMPAIEQWRTICPPKWAESTSKATISIPLMTAVIDWGDLPLSVLSQQMRDWIVAAAAHPQKLDMSTPIQWDGQGCGCVLDSLKGQIYGFYPSWWAQGKPQVINFSLMSRISHFSLPFDDDGNLGSLDQWRDENIESIRVARQHGTALDLTIFRNDWSFLQKSPEAARNSSIDRMVNEVPQRAMQLIDQSLSDWPSRAKAWLPGFAQKQYYGDGITIYFDDIPDGKNSTELWGAFNEFYAHFVQKIIQVLENGNRPYTINIVVPYQHLGEPGAFDVQALFDLLKLAEKPDMSDGRIKAKSATYNSNTNLTIRFIVMLPEPTTNTKKSLRQLLESSPALLGNNRRIFMRRVIPVITYPQVTTLQFADDMAYFEDNFGGVGFWPVPIMGETAQESLLQTVSDAFTMEISNANIQKLGGMVCVHRWALRLLFVGMVLLVALIAALVFVDCKLRQRFLRFLPAALVPLFMLGGLLYVFDPSWHGLRQSGAVVYVIFAMLLGYALYTIFKPKVEMP